METLPPTIVIELILKAFFRVYNRLDYGFLESVYRAALIMELRALGLDVIIEPRLPVVYEGVVIGIFRPDLLVNGCVIVEIKATNAPVATGIRQLRNYLRCADCTDGILLNFGTRPVYHVERCLSGNKRTSKSSENVNGLLQTQKNPETFKGS